MVKNRISISPDVCNGKPVIIDAPITFQAIVDQCY